MLTLKKKEIIPHKVLSFKWKKFSFLKTHSTAIIFPCFPIGKWKVHHKLAWLFGPASWNHWLNPNFLSSIWIPSMHFLTNSCPINNVPPDFHFANKFPESYNSSKVYHHIKQHFVTLWLHLPDLINLQINLISLPLAINLKFPGEPCLLSWIPGFKVKAFEFVFSSHMSHYIG